MPRLTIRVNDMRWTCLVERTPTEAKLAAIQRHAEQALDRVGVSGDVNAAMLGVLERWQRRLMQ